MDRYGYGKSLGPRSKATESTYHEFHNNKKHVQARLKLLKEKLKEDGIPVNKISFEVTENAAIKNISKARDFIETIKKHGCKFALDDFGSGHSSFAYLKDLPVDILKIDGMFVKGINSEPVNFAMVKAINDVGQVMNMKTIAEYVENFM